MEVQYQCNLADYKEALATQGPRSLNHKVLGAVLGCILITFGVFVMVSLGFRQGVATVAIIILLPTLGLVFRYAAYPLWAKRDFRRHPNFQREVTLRIDEDGLHKKSEMGQSETKWLGYTKYRETKNLFLLYLGERLIEVVPKRVLSGPQLEELRQLLCEKLPKNANISDCGRASVSSLLA